MLTNPSPPCPRGSLLYRIGIGHRRRRARNLVRQLSTRSTRRRRDPASKRGAFRATTFKDAEPSASSNTFQARTAILQRSRQLPPKLRHLVNTCGGAQQLQTRAANKRVLR